MLWKENKYICLFYILLLTFVFGLLFAIEKKQLHISLNNFNSSFFDSFFKTVTFLGDGIFLLMLCLFLMFWKARVPFSLFLGYVVSGIFVQLGKRVFWPNAPRPSSLFDEGVLHLVEGIKLHSMNSFPSGHTATAFALFFLLIFYTPFKPLKFLFFILACLVGYSRVYLSQHFLFDVAFGSVIGFLSAFMVHYYVKKMKYNWLEYSFINKNG